jgi:predicted nucleic acid-binding protein
VLFEYVSVITSPKRVAAPRMPEEAWAEVAKLAAVFPLVLPPLDHVTRVEALARQVRHRGAEVFDLAIAATMLAAGIQEIFTFDGAVFGRVPGVMVRAP